MKLRNVIAQWILVRTFGYAVALYEKLSPLGHPRREHLELLRGVCAALHHQIYEFAYPAMKIESPTAKRFTNQWP